MIINNLVYKIKTASQEEIHVHLTECKQDFIPPLEERVNIKEYAKKLWEKSITFEAWSDRSLAGLVAAYFNDTANRTGFITSVSVLEPYKGSGIASALMEMCIDYGRKAGCHEISLSVSPDNKAAILLYEKFGWAVSGGKDNDLMMQLKIIT